MLFLGSLMLIISAYIVWREYATYLRKSLGELDEFILFIKKMQEKMECYLETPSSWINNFSSSELERIGFISNVREGMDIRAAYLQCEESSCISDDAKNILRELFERLGDGYLDNELTAIRSSLDKLSEIEALQKRENNNKIKAFGAMLGAVAVGIAILVI